MQSIIPARGRMLVVVGMLFALTTSPAAARDRYYKKIGSLGGSGYSNKQLGPDRWRTKGVALNRRGESIALSLAMYRAALLAKRAGYPYMQIVKSNLSLVESFAVNSEVAEFTVVGARSATAPLQCENKGGNARACRTLPTDETLREAAGVLRHSPAETAEDLASL